MKDQISLDLVFFYSLWFDTYSEKYHTQMSNKANNSLDEQLSTVNLHHENLVKLGNTFLQALTGQSREASVDLENRDGTIKTITIPSNIFLNNELSRLSQSLKNIMGLTESGSAIVAPDGTFREIFVESHRRTLPAVDTDKIEMSSTVKTSTNKIIESLLAPLTEVELTLPNKYAASRQTKIKKIVISDGDFSTFSEGMTFPEVKQILATGDYQYKEQEYSKENEPNIARYFGDFDVIRSWVDQNQKLHVIVNQLQYSDSLNVVRDSKRLDIGDILTSIDGSVRLQVEKVDIKTKEIVAHFDAGVGAVKIGSKQLSILSTEDITAKVRIPIRLNEKSLIFISPIEGRTGFASADSGAKIFDSTKFTVQANGDTFKFNEYFSSQVADIGQYFESIVRESLIPANLGETPNSPVLNTVDFNVTQINTHLTNTPNVKKLQKLQRDKDVVTSQVEALNTSIASLNTKISQGNYSTESKRGNDVAKHKAKVNEKLQKIALLGSIVAEINTTLSNVAEKTITPKYRVRGYWPVQTDIPSSITNPQKIVQYQARYRYVSNTGNTSNATQVTYTDENNKISATFTPWEIVKTEPLERIIDDNGNSKWVPNAPTDADKLNINQIDVPIQYGEAVEIQVRAISEAGWPVSPVTSDWSNLVRVDFPVELLQESDIASIARKNSEDFMQVRIQQEFGNQGITKHVSEAFYEQDKYFAHEAKKIASGYVTEEQKIISMFDYTALLENRVKFLEEQVNRRYATITAQILDEDLREYDVNNFTTIKLFAGYYTDEVDLTEPTNFGSIVEKTFYLRLMNRNAQTVEMLSINPGPLAQDTKAASYDQVPLLISGSNSISSQKNGQIFYNRYKDINGTDDLYLSDGIYSAIQVPTDDIDTNGIDSLKNIVHMNEGLVETVKLIDAASLSGYVAMTRNHPAYSEYNATGELDPLKAEFDRITQFNDRFKQDLVQNGLSDELIIKFADDDKHLIGQNSVGATMFTSLNSITSFQVNGIDTGSSKEIYSSEDDSLLIPIVFQYRMTDALGNPAGQSNLTSNSNFEFKKKLGFDLLVAGKKFSFDVQISAKFRPTSMSNNVGIQAIGSINTNDPNID